MLVIGSDSRVGLTPAQQAQAGNADVVQGQRSDVVMIWRVDPATRQIAIVSIPRDTLVSMVGARRVAGRHVQPDQLVIQRRRERLVQTIEANFGIPINHVMQVDFGGLEGRGQRCSVGSTSTSRTRPRTRYSGLDITTPGCQLLNGTQALAVARSRHYEYYEDGYWQYDGTSDFGRIQRQDAFLRALIDQAKTKYNPLTINALIGSIPQGIVIDDQLSLSRPHRAGRGLPQHRTPTASRPRRCRPSRRLRLALGRRAVRRPAGCAADAGVGLRDPADHPDRTATRYVPGRHAAAGGRRRLPPRHRRAPVPPTTPPRLDYDGTVVRPGALHAR